MTKKLASPTAVELQEAFSQFSNERPRASALMAAAWVDDALRAVLQAYLSRDHATASALLRADAPLGSFGVRIKIAFLLGLISSEARADLDSIREIRNQFAHVRTRVSFKTDKIAVKCKRLHAAEVLRDFVKRPLHNREKFLWSAYFIATILIRLSVSAKPPGPFPDLYQDYARSLRRISKSPAFETFIAAINEHLANSAV